MIVAIFDGAPAVALVSRRWLGIEEWYFGTRFSAPLWWNLSADWLLGLTRAEFDAGGGTPVLVGLNPDAQAGGVPFVSPDDETGLVWGFGFQWEFNERASIGIDYRRHNTQVFDVDTLSLGATWRIR